MIINCKEIRDEILANVKAEVEGMTIQPHLVIVSIGHDDPSEIYMRNKIKTAESVGIKCTHVRLDETLSQDELENELMKRAVADSNHAIILQLPIPSHLDEKRLLDCIPYWKDVDGLTDLNKSKLLNNDPDVIVPCTAKAVHKIINKAYGKDLSQANVTIINRSALIGKPLAQLLLNENATPTICHSKTGNVYTHIHTADIVVIGIGKPEYFDCRVFEEGQIVIDCGISYVNGKIKRDVYNDDSVNIKYADKVGIITTACVMENVIECCKL